MAEEMERPLALSAGLKFNVRPFRGTRVSSGPNKKWPEDANRVARVVPVVSLRLQQLVHLPLTTVRGKEKGK